MPREERATMETERQEHRMIAWREQKRQEGYHQVTVWLKADMKHLLEDLASQRREDLSETMTAAIVALAGATPARPRQAGPDYTVIRRMMEEFWAEKCGEPPPQAPLTPVTAGRQLKDPTYGSLTQAVYAMGPKLGRFSNAQMARAIGGNRSSVHHVLINAHAKGHVQKSGYTWTWLGLDTGEGRPG
jgi:hypothetical protein